MKVVPEETKVPVSPPKQMIQTNDKPKEEKGKKYERSFTKEAEEILGSKLDNIQKSLLVSPKNVINEEDDHESGLTESQLTSHRQEDVKPLQVDTSAKDTLVPRPVIAAEDEASKTMQNFSPLKKGQATKLMDRLTKGSPKQGPINPMMLSPQVDQVDDSDSNRSGVNQNFVAEDQKSTRSARVDSNAGSRAGSARKY